MQYSPKARSVLQVCGRCRWRRSASVCARERGVSKEIDVAKGVYLITGGASLIGSHIADQLLADGAQDVRLLDNYSLGTPSTIAHLNDEPRIRRIRGDVM